MKPELTFSILIGLVQYERIFHEAVLYALMRSADGARLVSKNISAILGHEISIRPDSVRSEMKAGNGRIDIFFEDIFSRPYIMELKTGTDDASGQLDSYSRYIRDIYSEEPCCLYISLDGKAPEHTTETKWIQATFPDLAKPREDCPLSDVSKIIHDEYWKTLSVYTADPFSNLIQSYTNLFHDIESILKGYGIESSVHYESLDNADFIRIETTPEGRSSHFRLTLERRIEEERDSLIYGIRIPSDGCNTDSIPMNIEALVEKWHDLSRTVYVPQSKNRLYVLENEEICIIGRGQNIVNSKYWVCQQELTSWLQRYLDREIYSSGLSSAEDIAAFIRDDWETLFA